MVEVAMIACDGCAKPLDPRDEPRDLAHVSDACHYCERCRLLFRPAPTPTMPGAAPRRRPGRRVG
jgi:hypothetical protein